MSEKENSLPPPVVELYPENKIQPEWQQRTEIGAGLVNLGNTCFINSVLQILTYTAPFANFCLSGDHIAKCNQTQFCMLCEMQKHVKRCFKNPRTPIRPDNIVQNLKVIADHMRLGRQEDAHEFLVYVLDAMKGSAALGMEGLDQFSMETTVVGRIFSGFLNSQVKCMNCNRRSCRYEAFNGISLDIRNMKTLVKAFETYVTPETLSGDNAYMCAKCNKKVTALKGSSIEKPPVILTVSLQRFDCFSGKKLGHHVQFEEELDVQPFLSSAQGYGVPYRLYAVIVHSGASSSSGHYFAFVKSPRGQWHCMNDAKVKPVPVSSVLSAQAYLLFYERCKTRRTPKDTTAYNVTGKDNQARQLKMARKDAEQERRLQDEKRTVELSSQKKELDKTIKNKNKTIREKDEEIRQLTAKNTQMQQLENSQKQLQSDLEEKDRLNSEIKQQVEQMAAELKTSKEARKSQDQHFARRLEKERDQNQDKVERMTAKFKSLNEEREREVHQLECQLKQEKAEHEHKVERMTAKFKSLKEEREREVHQLECRLKQEKAEHEHKIAQMAAELKSLNDEREREGHRLECRMQQQKAELEDKVERIAAELKSANEEREREFHCFECRLEQQKAHCEEKVERMTAELKSANDEREREFYGFECRLEQQKADCEKKVERLAAELKSANEEREREGHRFECRLEQQKVDCEEKQNERLKEVEKEQQEKDKKASETIAELQNTLLELREENERIQSEGGRLKERVSRLEEEKDEMRRQLNIALENQMPDKKESSRRFRSLIAQFFKKCARRKSSKKAKLSSEERCTIERDTAEEQSGIDAEVVQIQGRAEGREDSTTEAKELKVKQLFCCCGL